MKKLLISLLALLMCIAMVSCGDGSQSSTADEPTEPLDLTGTWVQVNSDSDDSWQEAVIDDETITINWVSDNGDSKSLYWAGSYVAPTEVSGEYSWTSENDHDQTDSALLASTVDTKDFSYKDGQLTYEASALGTTKTIRLEKE